MGVALSGAMVGGVFGAVARFGIGQTLSETEIEKAAINAGIGGAVGGAAVAQIAWEGTKRIAAEDERYEEREDT